MCIRDSGPTACVYQPFGTYASCEAQDTGTRLIGLFRISLVFQYLGYVVCHVLMDGGGFTDELFRVPVAAIAVVRRPVLIPWYT